jgi:hypothetical protein
MCEKQLSIENNFLYDKSRISWQAYPELGLGDSNSGFANPSTSTFDISWQLTMAVINPLESIQEETSSTSKLEEPGKSRCSNFKMSFEALRGYCWVLYREVLGASLIGQFGRLPDYRLYLV